MLTPTCAPAPPTSAYTTVTTDDCAVCTYVTEVGWLGPEAPGASHCRGCHRDWSSKREGHCSRCHEHFSDARAFDFHLGPDACRNPAEVTRRDGKPRLVARQRRFGTAWSVAFYGQRPDFFEGADGSEDQDDD